MVWGQILYPYTQGTCCTRTQPFQSFTFDGNIIENENEDEFEFCLWGLVLCFRPRPCPHVIRCCRLKKKQISRSLHWSFTGFHGGKKKKCYDRNNAEYGWHTWRRWRLIKFLMSWKYKPHLCKSLEDHFSTVPLLTSGRRVSRLRYVLRTTTHADYDQSNKPVLVFVLVLVLVSKAL